MKISDRIEKIILNEEESTNPDIKIETPIQSTGSTPEPKKDSVAPATATAVQKTEEPKAEENQAHKDFMTSVKPTMDKVKANQIVTWEELKKLSELFDKIK